VSPGGLFKPDIQLFNWGRVYFLENYGAMVNELIDLCGRSAIMSPTERQMVREAQQRRRGEAYDRL
jgi:aromatic ring hydroxylase